MELMEKLFPKKQEGPWCAFEINNCSSIASATQARIITYIGTVGIQLKKIGQKIDRFSSV